MHALVDKCRLFCWLSEVLVRQSIHNNGACLFQKGIGVDCNRCGTLNKAADVALIIGEAWMPKPQTIHKFPQ